MDVATHPVNGTDTPPARPSDSRRELPLVVGDRTYRLVESMNAYCVAEGLTNKTTAELVVSAASGSMVATRILLWCHLQAHHAEEFTRVEQAGDLVDAVGLDAVWQQLQALAGVTPAPAPAPRVRTRKAAH